MKIDNMSRSTPLARSIERIVREEAGGIDTDAVTLDLDERRQGKGENQEPSKHGLTAKKENPSSPADEVAEKPLSVVA